MKKLICWMFHDSHFGPWTKWTCHNYFATCRKCGRNRWTQSPALHEATRAAAVAAICVAVLVIIGYFLKYK